MKHECFSLSYLSITPINIQIEVSIKKMWLLEQIKTCNLESFGSNNIFLVLWIMIILSSKNSECVECISYAMMISREEMNFKIAFCVFFKIILRKQ